MNTDFLGAIITTPGPTVLGIDSGIIHKGIVTAVDYWGRPTEVVHNAKGAGVIVTTIEVFCGTGSWTLDRLALAGKEFETVNRALSMQGRKYDLTDYNCEQFVNEVYNGKPSSPQLWNWGLLAGLGVLTVAALASGGSNRPRKGGS